MQQKRFTDINILGVHVKVLTEDGYITAEAYERILEAVKKIKEKDKKLDKGASF